MLHARRREREREYFKTIIRQSIIDFIEGRRGVRKGLCRDHSFSKELMSIKSMI